MENIIIECSRSDALDPTSNASWTTNIPNGVTINNGDIITLRNCFINSNTSDAENIEIPEDLTLNFVVGYYDTNYGTLSTMGQDEIDYDYYIAYNQNLGSVATLSTLNFRCEYSSQPIANFVSASASFKDVSGKSYTLTWGFSGGSKGPNQPPLPIPKPASGEHSNVTTPILNYQNVVVSSLSVSMYYDKTDSFLGAQWEGMGQYGLSLNTGSIEIKIPSGEYTRTGIAKYITDRLQYAPPLYADTLVELNNDMMRRTDQGDNHLGIDDYEVSLNGDRFIVVLSELFPDIDSVLETGLNYDLDVVLEYTLFDENGEPTERITKDLTIESQANNGIFVGGSTTIKFTTPAFDLNDVYGLGILKVYVGDNNLVFKRVGFDPNDPLTKSYKYDTPCFYGSSENVLIYDDDRSVFAWQYLHMPYYGNNPPTICIKQLKNTTAGNAEAYNKYYTVTQLGGVFFLNLDPFSFWESLGFTTNDLIVPVQMNKMINRSDLMARITEGYSSLASLLDITNPKNINANIDQDIATTDTLQIFGKSLDDVSTGGFYLVECNFSAQNYFFQNGIKNSIQAIVSKYNQIRDYVTGYSDSSIGYQHFGIPFNLQSIHINILDPETKKPDPNIGDKSTIFIQVTRNPEPQNVK